LTAKGRQTSIVRDDNCLRELTPTENGQVERPRGGSPITRLLSHRLVLCAEELLILLVNFIMEQAVLLNPCLEEEEEEEEGEEEEELDSS
jgi:hypothetical protein